MTKLRYVEARFGLSALFRLPEQSWSPELLRKERACSMALPGALVTSEQLQGGSGMGCVDQSSWCVKQYGGERGQIIGMSRSVHVVLGARELNLMKIGGAGCAPGKLCVCAYPYLGPGRWLF